MHPLRVLLLVSLAMAAAVAMSFGYVLERASEAGAITPLTPIEVVGVSSASFVAFLIPWGAVIFWVLRRASDTDTLTERASRVAQGHYTEPVADRTFHGELDELARAIEEMRSMIVRERTSFEEQRAAIDEIVAGLGEGLLALSPRGKVVFANQRVAELIGSDGLLVGRSFLQVVSRQPLVAAFERALCGEASTDRLRVSVNGQERQIEIRVFPVAASTEIAAVALFIDITQIERLQRIRKDFLDDFSHEVRTPLAGLRSAVETFDQGGLSEEQDGQLRNIMTRQLERIERLVQDLSELNRIESGDLQLEKRPVDVLRMLRELCDDFAERGGAPVRIVLRGEASFPNVDWPRVQQVFTNLLDNAIKHGGQGEILVEVIDGLKETIARVSDEGDGIPPQERERIFHRFYRLDKSRSQNVPGLGLGLAITKHLVLQHGGSIRAESRSGGGATFEVRLPK